MGVEYSLKTVLYRVTHTNAHTHTRTHTHTHKHTETHSDRHTHTFLEKKIKSRS